MKHVESSILLNYFMSHSSKNPNFFHEYEVDCEQKISNIFWVDAQMRNDYELFGDSIVFNTTHKTNRNCCPLG